MSYIGTSPTTAAFPFDQFSGTGSLTTFTLSYAPASTTSIIVAVSGVVQKPNTYSVGGYVLTFTGAPPLGTNNVAVLYLGLPSSGVSTPGNTAYRSATDYTAIAGQTTFSTVGSYTVGFLDVYRNGSRLGSADFTATNGTTVVLAAACSVGDLVTIVYYTLTSLTNALPLTGGTVTGSTAFNSNVSINGGDVSGYTGFKNRIINGRMEIDQRNFGASVTPTDAQYTVDRWGARLSQASKFTVQQNAGSVTPPPGYSKYLGVTVGASASVTLGASDYFSLQYRIEGYNIADIAMGTVNAKTVTVSFWVRSSLTGTFGFSMFDGSATVSYGGSYTINSANTWEQKTVTIPGTASGTWNTTTGIGCYLNWSLGGGSSYTGGTANAWNGAVYYQQSGATNIITTNSATLYITGVQLEVGSNATSFEFRDYGRELQMCQRYGKLLQSSASGIFTSTTLVDFSCPIPPMRTAPIGTIQGTLKFRNLTLGGTVTANTPTIASNLGAYDGGFIEVSVASFSTPPAINAVGLLLCDANNGIFLSAEL